MVVKEDIRQSIISRDNTNVKGTEKTDNLSLIQFGSYFIDGVLLRVKTQDAKEWLEKFLDKYAEIFPVNIFIRMNPYRTLQVLWTIHLRIALRGHPLRRFLQITRTFNDLENKDLKNKFIEKGVRVIPLAPAWIPPNRVLIDLILEYIAGRIDEDIAKKVFYSAFLRIFKRTNIICVKNLTKWEPYKEETSK